MNMPRLGTSPDLVTGSELYARLAVRRRRILLILGLAALLSFMVDLLVGPAHYSIAQVFAALWHVHMASSLQVIVWSIRLPVALSALVVGASLSVAGSQMQTVLGNPLASPFTLGLSAAASFGAALGLLLGVSLPGMSSTAVAFAIPTNAFGMSMLAALLIYHLGSKRGMTTEVIVLLGTALVFTFSALLEALQYTAPDQALSAMVFWAMGSLARTSWLKLAIMTGVLSLVSLRFSHLAWSLTAMRMGEARASALGVPVARLRLQGILLSTLLASVCVAFVGTIGFIGLVGPHIARMLVGEDQRYLLPASGLCGALLLSTASILSKSLVSGQNLPIGIVTALVGVPFFFILILRTRPQ